MIRSHHIMGFFAEIDFYAIFMSFLCHFYVIFGVDRVFIHGSA